MIYTELNFDLCVHFFIFTFRNPGPKTHVRWGPEQVFVVRARWIVTLYVHNLSDGGGETYARCRLSRRLFRPIRFRILLLSSLSAAIVNCAKRRLRRSRARKKHPATVAFVERVPAKSTAFGGKSQILNISSFQRKQCDH